MGKNFKSTIATGMNGGGISSLIPDRSDLVTAENAPASGRSSTEKNVNFAIETDLHRRLKTVAASRGLLIKEALAIAIENYLDKFNEEH